MGTDHRAVLVELDAPRERTRALGRRYCAARGDVLLLVVRVLFKLFVISIVQYLELLLNSISMSSQIVEALRRDVQKLQKIG